jgi:murein DD-endopeptidase MepM/ murein hydrolase activator NlpD
MEKLIEMSRGMDNRGFSKILIVVLLPFLLLVAAYLTYNFFLIPEPEIKGVEAFAALPAKKTVTLQGINVKTIRITMIQDSTRAVLLEDSPSLSEATYNLEIIPSKWGFKDGRALVIIEARSGFIKKTRQEITAQIDTRPPLMSVMHSPSLIAEGSAGLAALNVKDADSVYISLGEMIFRAFRIEKKGPPENREPVPDARVVNRNRSPASTYLAFFPAPHGISESDIFYAVAEDEAGNRTVKALPTRIKKRKFRKSTIRISDQFIKRVVQPLLNRRDIKDPVEAFKTVNEQWRRNSHKDLLTISSMTDSRILWNGRFLQLRNSKVMATYGDERTYIYNDREISKSVHLGYDLASHANAPVRAANSGIVRFLGDLGIYGNTIIIDHGLGVMSLYGHLSVMDAKEGERINKGDVIGRTGSTGLAGGDHLHFGILVHGYEVSPLYWWDPKWLKINITEYLEAFSAD